MSDRIYDPTFLLYRDVETRYFASLRKINRCRLIRDASISSPGFDSAGFILKKTS
jgi:hypothetical protein